MRSAIGGWVDISRETSWARNGLAMIMWLALTSCWVGASGARGHAELELLQRAREGQRVAGERGAVLVGVVLAGAGDGHLDEHGGDRARAGPGRGRRWGCGLVVPPPKTPPKARNCPIEEMTPATAAATDAGEDVAVVDVHQLVAEDPAQLALVEEREDALGAADRGVRGLRPVAKALGAWVGET